MTKSLPTTFVERIKNTVRNKEDACQYGPIGVDLSQGSFRMVQFKKNEKGVELHASAHIPKVNRQLDSTRQLRSILKPVLKKNNFIGNEIVTCLQPGDVKIMMLSYLRQADKNDEELVVQRVAERIGDSIENYVIDYLMVRPEIKDGQERSVLAALADHDEVIIHLEYMRKAGFSVKVLEIEPTAVRRLISAKHDNEHNVNLMSISMGHAQTYITVLSGRRLIYERDIGFGEQQLIAALCKELDISEHEARTMLVRGSIDVVSQEDDNEEDIQVTEAFYGVLKPLFMELVEDVNRALIYAAAETRGLPVKHVYLTGQVATWDGIENFIKTLIEVPVSILLPFEEFSGAEMFSANSGPRGAAVAGMALYGLTEIV